MSRIKISIIAAFAFAVLAGGFQNDLENGCFSVFFPSSAVAVDDTQENSEKIGSLTVVDDTGGEIKLGFRLAEIFKGIFGI